jgi:hypothetical protein
MKKTLFITLLILLVGVNAFAGQWDKGIPQSDDYWIDYTTDAQANNDALDRALSNYRQGLKLTYSSGATVVVGTGEIVVSNSDGSVRLMLNNTSTTNVTFSDIDTGAEAGSTTYYVYAIAANASAETATFKISTSSTAPTGVTYYKRIGSFYNNSSSDIDAARIVNDNTSTLPEVQNSILYTKENINMGGKTISNGYIGKTTTGSSANFNSGTTITVPTGCYVIGGYKQPDGNFIRWDYACP